MSYSSEKVFNRLENKLICKLESIIGEGRDFNLDHRLFNSICLIAAVSYVLRILINLIMGIKLIELTLSHIIAILCIFSIYIISRVLKKFRISKVLLFFVILISFSFNWYYTGGTTGNMPFYYFSLLIVILFITKRKFKVLVILIVLMHASLLIFLEYRYPNLIIQKVEDNKIHMYKYVHFLFVSVLTIFIIQVAITSFRKDKYINSELVKNIHNIQKYINNDASGSFNILTSQEKKVLELIIFGKRNKEIASVLHVDICTIKTHINNIYKKIGIHNRSGVLNLLN